MTMRQKKAVELFQQGYNCAQAVFAAFADVYGIDTQTALKLSCSFGGGLGRLREVCGTVSGMAMVASLENGNTDANNQKAKTENYELVRELAEEFQKRNGSIICKELLGLEKREQEAAPSERTNEYYQKRPCVQLVEEAAGIIEERIMQGKQEYV